MGVEPGGGLALPVANCHRGGSALGRSQAWDPSLAETAQAGDGAIRKAEPGLGQKV